MQSFAARALAAPSGAAAAAEAPSHHLVAERISGPGGSKTLHIYRFWACHDVNGEVPASDKEGPFFIPADAIELSGPADTGDGVQKQLKKVCLFIEPFACPAPMS